MVNAPVLEQRSDSAVFHAGDGCVEVFHSARDAISVVGRGRPACDIAQRLRVVRPTRSLASLFQQKTPTIESALIAAQPFPWTIPAIAAQVQ